VFHVSQLKKAIGNHHVKSEMLPDLQGQGQEMILEEILGRITVTAHGSSIDIEMIKEQFP